MYASHKTHRPHIKEGKDGEEGEDMYNCSNTVRRITPANEKRQGQNKHPHIPVELYSLILT